MKFNGKMQKAKWCKMKNQNNAKADAKIDIKHKKGYVISLAVITILLILSILAVQIISFRYEEYSTLRNQLFGDKVGFIVNDVLMDIRKVLSVNQAANSSIISISENYSYAKSSFLSTEQARLSEFANLTNANITLVSPSPSSVVSITFSNGMSYSTNETDQNNKEVLVQNASGPSLIISGYNVTIRGTQNKNINSISLTSGTLHVVLTSYNTQTGQSNTYTYDVDGSAVNVWRINAPNANQNVTIIIGSIQGKSNSLSIRQYSTNSISYLITSINMSDNHDVIGRYNIFLYVNSSNAVFSDYLKTK